MVYHVYTNPIQIFCWMYVRRAVPESCVSYFHFMASHVPENDAVAQANSRGADGHTAGNRKD